MKKNQPQEELKFDVRVLPPPTIPLVSWAEARANYQKGPVLGSPAESANYFKQYIGGKKTEAFLTMYLDHRNHVLDVVLNQEGTVDTYRRISPRGTQEGPGIGSHRHHL